MLLGLALLGGAFGWTLVEYLLHRFGAHTFSVDWLFRREHLMHHRKKNYFASTADKAKLAVVVTAAWMVLIAPWAGWMLAAAFTGGFVASYLLYEWIHRDLHVRAPTGAYGRWARRHHMQHHHMVPHLNHGVTSPLWDWVFGTLAESVTVRVAYSKRPDWLDASSEAAWRHDYELIGAGKTPQAAGAAR